MWGISNKTLMQEQQNIRPTKHNRLELAKFMYQLHHKKFQDRTKDCFVDITNIHSHNT